MIFFVLLWLSFVTTPNILWLVLQTELRVSKSCYWWLQQRFHEWKLSLLNTTSGKQSLGYFSLDTLLHSDPHGNSLALECCAHSLSVAFGVPYCHCGIWLSEKNLGIICTPHSPDHWQRCWLVLVLTLIPRGSWDLYRCVLHMFSNAFYDKTVFISICYFKCFIQC